MSFAHWMHSLHVPFIASSPHTYKVKTNSFQRPVLRLKLYKQLDINLSYMTQTHLES